MARVLQEIAPQLSSSARARLVEPGTRNGDAYESYLRGRAYAAQVTGADFARAAESFRQAVTLDPNYADAWAALGAACRRLPLVGDADRKARSPRRACGQTRAGARPRPPRGPVGARHGGVLVRVGLPARRGIAASCGRASAELRRLALYLAHLLSNLAGTTKRS